MKGRFFASTLVFIAMASSLAHAGSLKFDMRTDMDSVDYNAANGGKNSTSFLTTQGRLDFNGAFNEDLTYRLRWRFIVPSVTTGGNDKTAGDIDYAAITHKMNMLSVTVGKFAVDIGGHETIMPDPDYYFLSDAGKAISSGFKNGAVSYLFPAKYNTGFKLALKSDLGEVAAIVVNNPEGEFATTPKEQSRPFTGLVYKGQFMEKTFSPILSWHQASMGLDSVRASTTDSKATYLDLGLKYDVPEYYAQFDWVDVTAAKVTDTASFPGSTSVDAKINSMVLDLGYKMENLTPKLKLESSQTKISPDTGTESKSTTTGVGLALEYKPWVDTDFRYHVAATQKSVKPEGADAKLENHIIVGVRIVGDFLK